MSMLDDDMTEARLRAALREIAERDLDDRNELPRLPTSLPARRRTWRPLLVAAALVIIAVLNARGDSREGSSVILDQRGSTPVRVIPGPLPEGTTWRSVGERTAADVDVDLGRHAIYAHHNGEMIDQVVILSIRNMPPADSLETRRVLDADGINVWARDEPRPSGNVRSTDYVFEHPSCGGTFATAYRTQDREVLALIAALECGDEDEIVARSLPYGFQRVGADAIFGSRQTAVVLQNIRGEMAEGSWAVVEGRPAMAPFLTFAPADDIQTLTIGGRTVYRTVFDGVPFFEWEQGGAVVVMNLGRPLGPSAGQEDWGVGLERVVAGSTVVSEAEWQAWLDQKAASPTTSLALTTSSSVVDENTPSVGSGLVHVVPGPLPAGAKVGSITGETSETRARRYVGTQKWGKVEGGVITSVLFAQYLGEEPSNEPGDLRDAHGRPVWIHDDATAATLYVVQTEDCGLAMVTAHQANEADAMALVNSVRCGADGASVEASPPDGYREVSADELSGTSQTIVNLTTANGQYLGAFAVTNGYPTKLAPFLLVAKPEVVEHVQIAGQEVYRAQVGHNLVHAWYIDGVSVAIASPSMSDAEVEALIAGTRVVSEAEWQAWAASVER